ncbi:E3 ubiquitin-protein ligase DZIP3-like [Stylophora pistillata]|uniref:E3 ubiquitin-protein ligase DZIP3-like n=1 Tax=Stylophora pistillata TaxID=50429 RepID=UPI000C040AB4|nr:E3 ubiquitin-protein ligase DZIP3-like [Stylophora pistillata]
MAASLDPDRVLCCSKEKDNFLRIARLLISGGTVLLREVFDDECPPSNLPKILQNQSTEKRLRAAKLTKPQWDCLYPSPGMYGKSTDFDITLLFRLLRNICSFTPPVTGWDALPASKDYTFEADLARIKYFRNSIYGHVNENMEIADDCFVVLWREISGALVRIAGQISSTKSKEWQNAIERFLQDPITEADKRYEQELWQLYQNDTEIKEFMNNLDCSVKHVEKAIYVETRDIKDRLGGEVKATTQEVQGLRKEVREEARDIKDHLGGEVKATTQEVQDLRKEVREEARDIKVHLGREVKAIAQEVYGLRQDICSSVGGTKSWFSACAA